MSSFGRSIQRRKVFRLFRARDRSDAWDRLRPPRRGRRSPPIRLCKRENPLTAERYYPSLGSVKPTNPIASR